MIVESLWFVIPASLSLSSFVIVLMDVPVDKG